MKKKIWTSADLDLHSIEPVCKKGAIEAFDDQGGAAFAGAGYSWGATLAVVFDNVHALKQRGMLEAALIEGYIGCKLDHRAWSLSVIQFLFDQCDRDKLRAIGAPLPGPGPFTIYRGVYRNGRQRQVHSFSWTGTLDVACRFALRGICDNPTPAVYRATVAADEVYCYYTERSEDEFVCHPKRAGKIILDRGRNESSSRSSYRGNKGSTGRETPSVVGKAEEILILTGGWARSAFVRPPMPAVPHVSGQAAKIGNRGGKGEIAEAERRSPDAEA